MLDRDFLGTVEPLYSPVMGTEAMAPLLYSLIRFERPRNLLEVGAGYTTPFILKALADNTACFTRELNSGDQQGQAKVNDFYDQGYAPKLLCIDNDSHPDSTASKVMMVAQELQLEKYINIVFDSFEGYSKKLEQNAPPFDLVWFDCGGIVEYTFFVNEFWPYINPNGGLLLLHSTQTNLTLNHFIKSIKLRQATSEFNNMELIGFLEPHKQAQNSVTVIRRTSAGSERMYTLHP